MRKNLRKIHVEKKKKAITKECPLGVLFNAANKMVCNISKKMKRECEDIEDDFHNWLYKFVFLEKGVFRRHFLINAFKNLK